jgi:hypothetical protein
LWSISPTAPPRSLRRPASISPSSWSASASGSVIASVARASSWRPFITYQRGVSGSRTSTARTSSDGTADNPSIQRHASAPASA